MPSSDLPARVYREALHYLEASKLISSRVGDYGHSSVMLSVFSFELLLKCVHLLEHDQLSRHGHNYRMIWNSLSDPVRHELIRLARTRQSGEADYYEIDRILEDLQSAFTKARHGFEIDADLTDTEVLKKEQKWIEGGALDEDADFRFRPMEREGLIYAMANFIQRRFGNDENDVLAG